MRPPTCSLACVRSSRTAFVRALAVAAVPLVASLAAGCGGDSEACTGTTTFAAVKADVLSVSCSISTVCHDPTGQSNAGKLDLKTDPYAALVNAPTFLDTAKAD